MYDNLGSSGGTASTPFTVVGSQENPVSTARNRITQMEKEVRDVAGTISQIAGHLFGEIAVATPPNAPVASRPGEFGLLHGNLDDLRSAIGELQNAVLRLNPLLPNIKLQANSTR